jgi:predicted RNA-binding protein with PUA domain
MKQWSRAAPGDLFYFYCSICSIPTIYCRTAEHKKNVTIKLTPNQLHLSAASSMESGGLAKLLMHLGAYVVRDESIVAEITLALKMIESDYSGKFQME